MAFVAPNAIQAIRRNLWVPANPFLALLASDTYVPLSLWGPVRHAVRGHLGKIQIDFDVRRLFSSIRFRLRVVLSIITAVWINRPQLR